MGTRYFWPAIIVSSLTLFADNWQEYPLEQATCARGDDFSFFVSEGNPEKVIIDFIGGGPAGTQKDTAQKNQPPTPSNLYVLVAKA